jgi:uncharacterized membrane protein
MEATRRRPRRDGGGRIRWAFATLVGLAVGTVVGLVVLWPGKVETPLSGGLSAPTEHATVDTVTISSCPAPAVGNCGAAGVTLDSGPEAGQQVDIQFGGPSGTELSPGDDIRVSRVVSPLSPPGAAGASPGATTASGEQVTYNFVDFERRLPILLLALAFAGLVILFGRRQGALSLLGLAISLVVILVFVVPALLDGESPLAVALVGSLAVMFAAIPLAHGFGPKSLAAMLGTAASLALVIALALLGTKLAHLTGASSEEAQVLSLNASSVSLQGVLIAGMVIGALGVLDDVTVSQASTVLALRGANPDLSARELYGRALKVGRDHVSATVNTLVLAYAGSSLALLLLFGSGQLGLLEALNTEVVAKEVVAMLVGSIGLIVAVPITTALAAILSRDFPVDALLAEAEAGHAH